MKKQMQLQEGYFGAAQKTNGIINDSIANIFSIKIIGDIKNEIKTKLKPTLYSWTTWYKKSRKFDAYYTDTLDTILCVAMSATTILLLAMLYRNDQITAGGFAFIIMISMHMHYQLDEAISGMTLHINPAIAQMRVSYEFINQPIGVVDPESGKRLGKVKGEIEYRDVCFRYSPRTKEVLHNFNLRIKGGEQIGMVGVSGMGRTTIVKCLLRYFDVNDGEIYIDETNIRDVTQESLRANISIIPQDITMFHRSVRDNLVMAKPDATDA
jgi:ATP-binding cassette, subfamily B, bacterial